MQRDASEPTRLVYLDWIRVIAFGLLILFHVGMFYVTWDWHVKSDHAGHLIEPAMMLTSPWRLTLLFLVSGAATRFMADRMEVGRLARRRFRRLFVPLLFGILVIVPPQSYYEVVEKIAYPGGYPAFWSRYLSADQSFCNADGCLILPTWNHLWFVAYLLVYTLLLTLLLRTARAPLVRLEGFAGRHLRGIGLLAWPILFLAAARLILAPMFEVTHMLIDDWYNHAVSFSAFLLGFLVLKKGNVTAECVRLRWPSLGIFLCAYVAYASCLWIYRDHASTPPEALKVAMRMVYAVDQWSAIVAFLGFGALHLNRDSRLLRTLTEAVFPFYIVHQTIIVVAGHNLKPLRLPALSEASLLILVTVMGCWLSYEAARRIPILRPLFGLSPRRPTRRPPALDPVPSPN